MDFSLVVGIDKYSKLSPTPCAENDAREIDRVLRDVMSVEHQTLLLGTNATLTSIMHALEEILKKLEKDDRLIFFFAGHGVNFRGIPHVSSYDSVAGTAKTWINVETLIKRVNKTGCDRSLYFIDSCESTIKLGSRRIDLEPLTFEDRKRFIEERMYSLVFSACSHKQIADYIEEEQHGVWTYFLLTALRGEEDSALTAEKWLTSGSLSDYLNVAVKRYCRQTPEATLQTSHVWGKKEGDIIIHKFPATIAVPYKDVPKQALKRVVFRATKVVRADGLSGFKKGVHTRPKYLSEAANGWIQRWAQPDLKEEMEEVTAALRELFGLKLDDYKLEIEDGEGSFTCPYLRYWVSVKQSEADYEDAEFEYALDPLNAEALIAAEGLEDCFPRWFDEVHYSFPNDIDIPDLIRKIESVPEDKLGEWSFSYKSDASSITFRTPPPSRTIVMDEEGADVSFLAKEPVKTMLGTLREVSNVVMLAAPKVKLLQ